MVYYYNAISNWNWGDHSSSNNNNMNNTSTSWWVTCVRPDVRQYLNGQQMASRKKKRERGRKQGGEAPQYLAYNLHFSYFFSRLLLKAKSFWGLPGFDVCQSYVRVKILSNLISINPFPPQTLTGATLASRKGCCLTLSTWQIDFGSLCGHWGTFCLVLAWPEKKEQIVKPELAKRALQINVCSGFVSLPTY